MRLVFLALALLCSCYPRDITHAQFASECKLKSHVEGALERQSCMCAGTPAAGSGLVYLRGLSCYQCGEVERCWSDGDEP